MSASLLEPDEHVLSTLERDGRRRWLFPTLSRGPLWQARRIVGGSLIAIFVLLPYITINGKPSILIDLPARRFTFFGFTFLPTDTVLLALFLVGTFLSIFLITALVGRVWCGWACPQTVYMEFVFRPIERLFEGTRGRGGKPSSRIAALRKAGKWGAYLLLSMLIAHIFLAYFVGVDKLAVWIRQSPYEHPIPFLVMAAATGLVLFDFAYFREQTCLIACPYGRFQSVLLDRNSLIVAYDVNRGEPRGKLRRGLPVISQQGDCIDCGACVRTCPTGIDIRKGLQMECINCTQCIDACNDIMEKVNKPHGLIRYSCQAAIEGGPSRKLRPRVVLYPLALAAIAVAFFTLLVGRDSFDATLLRNFGSPFSVAENGRIQNSFRLKIVNRSDQPLGFEIALAGDAVAREAEIEILAGGEPFELAPGESVTRPILVAAPASAFQLGGCETQLRIRNKLGEEELLPCRLLGPLNASPQQ